MSNKIRLIAFYLPQYHPIPENDKWWGKGFTEWTNTAKAKPMFRGHYQPHVPADLGFYDLRLPEARIAQAEMAQEFGIEAFCYYHYWYAGRRILERPFNEVLSTGEPDFPFCLCWANHSWTGIWHGAKDRMLIEQTYPGDDDHYLQFYTLLKAFTDKRYVTINNKPVFLVYKPLDIPGIRRVTNLWRELALKEGLAGLHLVGVNLPVDWNPQHDGFDANVRAPLPQLRQWVSLKRPIKWLVNQYQIKTGKPTIFPYEKLETIIFDQEEFSLNRYPCVLPNWDNTPRSGSSGLVLHGSTPELFRKQVQQAFNIVKGRNSEHRLVFIKSWNEWAEGNHLEPDLLFGKAYLNVLQEECNRT